MIFLSSAVRCSFSLLGAHDISMTTTRLRISRFIITTCTKLFNEFPQKLHQFVDRYPHLHSVWGSSHKSPVHILQTILEVSMPCLYCYTATHLKLTSHSWLFQLPVISRTKTDSPEARTVYHTARRCLSGKKLSGVVGWGILQLIAVVIDPNEVFLEHLTLTFR